MNGNQSSLRELLKELLTEDAIANYDSSLCWGCGEVKTGECAINCLLERVRLALRESESSQQWQPIATAPNEDRVEVDLWMIIPASLKTMGFGDSFRVPDAYRVFGKWCHIHEGKEKALDESYITHWMPLPCPPTGGKQ